MMRLLLDTHIYLWWLSDHKALSKAARATIVAADEIYISSVSIWEAVIKVQLGKLEAAPELLVSSIESEGFIELPMTAKHAVQLFSLPDYHRDPFDRMLIAQAISEPLVFLTSDKNLATYSSLIKLI